MEIRTLRTFSLLTCLFSAAVGSGCGSSPSSASSTPLDPTAFGLKYKISGLSCWTEDPSGYWSGTDLVAAGIDGGNVAYDNNGFRQGMFETLNGPDPQTCDLRAMDFGDDAHATKMFTDAVTSHSATVAIPPFGTSVAAAGVVIGGLNAVAHFKASYFEVALTGYADQNLAISDAALFLQAFQTKTN